MNKRNKLKKGIIKVSYFDKKCNCNISTPTVKVVDNKDHSICTSCNCVSKDPILLSKFYDHMGHMDSNVHTKQFNKGFIWFNSHTNEEFLKWCEYLKMDYITTFNENIYKDIVDHNWKSPVEVSV